MLIRLRSRRSAKECMQMPLLGKLGSPMGALYREGGISGTRIKSLRYLMLGTVLGTLFTSVTSGGTMLTGYFTALGGSAFAFGILSAIPFLAVVVQIPASILISRTGARKKYRIKYGIIARAIWILIGLIPLLIPMHPVWLRICGLCVFRGLAAGCEAFPETTYGPWLADLVPQNIRGRWLSIRDIICNVAGISIGVVQVFLLERMPGLTGYTVIFVAGGLIGIADMLCSLRIEDVPMATEAASNLSGTAKQVFRDKPFVQFMLFWTFWLFTAYLANPYTNFYALQKLGLSMSATTIYGQVIPAIISVVVSPFWGYLIDKLGNKRVMFLSCTFAALAPVILVFSEEGQSLAFFLYNLFGSMVWSVPFLVALNMMLCNSPHDDRTSYVAIFHCFTELLGSFLGVLFGGSLIEFLSYGLQKWSFARDSVLADEYKLLFLLSALLRIAATLLIVPRLRDRKEGADDPV